MKVYVLAVKNEKTDRKNGHDTYILYKRFLFVSAQQVG